MKFQRAGMSCILIDNHEYFWADAMLILYSAASSVVKATNKNQSTNKRYGDICYHLLYEGGFLELGEKILLFTDKGNCELSVEEFCSEVREILY